MFFVSYINPIFISAFDEYYGQALRVRRLICDELADALKDHRCLLAPTVASFDVPLAGKFDFIFIFIFIAI